MSLRTRLTIGIACLLDGRDRRRVRRRIHRRPERTAPGTRQRAARTRGRLRPHRPQRDATTARRKSTPPRRASAARRGNRLRAVRPRRRHDAAPERRAPAPADDRCARSRGRHAPVVLLGRDRRGHASPHLHDPAHGRDGARDRAAADRNRHARSDESGLFFVAIWLVVVAAAAADRAAVSRTMLKPVLRLTEDAERIAATGDLRERTDQSRSDELGRLAVAFNTMLDALARSVSAQRQLVADASHELRTPLATARTNLEVIELHGEIDAADRGRILAEAIDELREMTRLIEELVDLARGDVQPLETQPVRLDHRRRGGGRGSGAASRPHVRHRPRGDGRRGLADRTRPRDREPPRQRGQVEPAGRDDHRDRRRRRRVRARPRSGDRRRGSPPHVRPLLPRDRRTYASGLGTRTRDRPTDRRGARRHHLGRCGRRRRRHAPHPRTPDRAPQCRPRRATSVDGRPASNPDCPFAHTQAQGSAGEVGAAFTPRRRGKGRRSARLRAVVELA